MHIILTGRLSASFPCLASLRQPTQACCEPVKITAKFQWFWILYYFVFLIYTDGYSNHHGVYVIRYWLLIFVFMNGDL